MGCKLNIRKVFLMFCNISVNPDHRDGDGGCDLQVAIYKFAGLNPKSTTNHISYLNDPITFGITLLNLTNHMVDLM
jgi:hypothetical protein